MILDGCGVHHSKEVHDVIHDMGGLVVFLEPYDPQHMPIEIGFRAAKAWLRRNHNIYAHLPQRERLRLALKNVCEGAGRNAFLESGYPL